MKPFIKTVNPGSVKIGKRYCDVFVEIEYSGGKLSLRGVIGQRRNGVCAGSAGQIAGELFNIERFTNGWARADVETLAGVWRAWHLNHMNPGCVHQDGWGTGKELTLASGEQRPAGHTYREEHPGGLLGEPCPVCGYKYGTAWLKREVPEDVLRFLSGLPDTEKRPPGCKAGFFFKGVTHG